MTVNINLANFYLEKGTFNEISTTLPQFNVSNDFSLDPGNILPSSNISFTRALGGSGTTIAPYLITDLYGLEGIGSSAATLADSYALVNDIDASPANNWNTNFEAYSGTFEPIGSTPNSLPFTGNFNGNFFTINNLTVDGPNFNNILLNGNGAVGLFQNVSGGTISNLGRHQ